MKKDSVPGQGVLGEGRDASQKWEPRDSEPTTRLAASWSNRTPLPLVAIK